MAEALFSNDNYIVTVAERMGMPDVMCYHVLNVNFDVVEMETSVLVQAIQFATESNKLLLELAHQQEIEEQVKRTTKKQSEVIASS